MSPAIARLLLRLFLMTVASGLGFSVFGLAGAFGALVLCVLVVLIWDARADGTLLRFLQGQVADPRLVGMAGELLGQAQRGFRSRDKIAVAHEERLKIFLEAIQRSPMGVVLLDEHNRIDWCNQTAAEHFGFDVVRDQLQHVTNLVRAPGFASYLAGRDWSEDLVMPGRRSTFNVEVSLAVRLHAYGQGAKMMLSRDVTLLERAAAMRRDFVANVSHEIRTPLTVLSGFVETLQTLPLSPTDQLRYLGLMATQAQRMQALVSDLLTLSRLDGAAPPGNEARVDVVDLLLKIEQTIGLDIGQMHNLKHIFEFSGHLTGSFTEIESAITNVMANALRYTPPGRVIELGVRLLSNGDLAIWVRDEGLGIGVEHLSRLTERFYRVDKSRSRETGGTGLGLAIVKHVMQRHGGQLDIKSVLGEGSTFTLIWPRQRVWPA